MTESQDTPSEGGSLLRGGLKWIWDNKDWVLTQLSTLRTWFQGDGEERGIVFIGPGGVGKSTLGKLLAGDYDPLLASPGEYEESLDIETYSYKHPVCASVEIVVPPGQSHRRDATWNDLLSDIAASKFRGIVNFASYGYHSLGEFSFKDHKLYTGDDERFLEDYLEAKRKDELEVLSAVIPSLKLVSGKLWILTLVTKQDLWWPHRLEVERHYRRNEYSTLVSELLRSQDRRRFRCEIVFASLVISSFTTGMGELLQKNVGGYDHESQVTSLRRLIETIGSLKDWEER